MKKSPAYLTVEKFRDTLNPEFERVDVADLSHVYYIQMKSTGPWLKVFIGRQKRPSVYTKFHNEKRMVEFIKDYSTKMDARTERRQPVERALEVGDILRASWGYDQTNIDYYKVLKLVGKTQVDVIEIGMMSEATGSMQGMCIPDDTQTKGDVMRRKADGDRVKICDVFSAYKMEPTIIAGAKLYKASNWSSYH